VLAPRLIGPLLGIALAVALYPGTWGLDALARGQLGPGFWPRLALIGLALASAAKLVEEWRRGRAGVAGVVARPSFSRVKLAAGIGAVVLYVLLAPLLGFALATAPFIAGFMALCGTRSVAVLTGSVAVGTTALLYVFVKLVYLPLPKGDGPFEAVTLALYRALRLF
jgi:putative tricarboxylic transport membrane protein